MTVRALLGGPWRAGRGGGGDLRTGGRMRLEGGREVCIIYVEAYQSTVYCLPVL